MTDLYDPNARSNSPHLHAYVVQAWDSSLDQWLDTIHGHDRLEVCLEASVRTATEPSRWVGEKVGKVRVVPRIARKN